MGDECFSPTEGEKTEPASLIKWYLMNIFRSILKNFRGLPPQVGGYRLYSWSADRRSATLQMSYINKYGSEFLRVLFSLANVTKFIANREPPDSAPPPPPLPPPPCPPPAPPPRRSSS